ncbi:Nicotinate-nucleotide pyrophosphorylase [carboxylating] [Paraburkholderia ultramafica]|uniref:nicotinate-nucleotide diphosphorylase (carboxylating) n=1 Tax=Paraburkholderia ultramafica TaxID=1544867 RepID=A0A6S7D582_9BURK|nr:carboxylating nicotinate-nucleotide diphosphorylase [Paraburkholderia ultramafica]CAB3807008.1 Nicotinate-nucleotide pyrophosphorylase [carboxylating] [Paraburkholderia ultramafica]
MDATLLAAVSRNVRDALDEDRGIIDWTSQLINADTEAHATLMVRQEATLCGRPWFDEALLQVDDRLEVNWFVGEGAPMEPGDAVCEIAGPARGILTAERTALNFIQMLSAVATATKLLVERIRGTRARVFDTRKTLPGLRLAQKYAVGVGGGSNHRLGLYDGILIKENHIHASGGIAAAIRASRALEADVPIQVEVEDLGELAEALAHGATSILLDNFSLEQMREAVMLNGGNAELEVSGGVSDLTILAIAQTGVDRISVGGLTKNIQAVDFSLRFADTPEASRP